MDTRAEVLRLTQEGLGAAQIANQLGISRQAVYKHIKALRRDGLLPEATPTERESKTPVVTRMRGGQPSNRNAVVHGVYARLLAGQLGETQWAVLMDGGELPTLDAIDAELRTLYIQRSMGIKFVADLTGLPGEMVLKLAGSTSGTNGLGNHSQSTSMSEPTREAVLRTFAALDRTQARVTALLRLKAAIEARVKDPPEGQVHLVVDLL